MVYILGNSCADTGFIEIVMSVLRSGNPITYRDKAIERDFLDMMDRNKSVITRICFYFASDSAEFQDLRQDVLLNLWRGFASFRGDSSESTWIYRVCFNTCMTCMRGRRKEISMPSIDVLADRKCFFDEYDSAIDQRIAQLHRAISMLPPLDRSIIMMQLNGRSYEEICNVTGMKRNTVATRMRRAKLRLAELMKDA